MFMTYQKNKNKMFKKTIFLITAMIKWYFVCGLTYPNIYKQNQIKYAKAYKPRRFACNDMLILSFYFPLTTFTLITIQIYVYRITQIYLFFNKRFLLFITPPLSSASMCIQIMFPRIIISFCENFIILVTITYRISGGRLDKYGRQDVLKQFCEHIFWKKISFKAGCF